MLEVKFENFYMLIADFDKLEKSILFFIKNDGI